MHLDRSTYISRKELENQLQEALHPSPREMRSRLVTLCGATGMGKTRLAVQYASEKTSEKEQDFSNGAFFIPFHGQEKSSSVKQRIRRVVKQAWEEVPLKEFVRTLSTKQVLFVLDGFEAAPESAVREIAEILRNTTALCFLVTSSKPTNITDLEKVISFQNGMTEQEAKALFSQRAQSKKNDVEIHNSALLRILKFTHRIPLALELAATWVDKRSVDQIVHTLAAKPLGESSSQQTSARMGSDTPHHKSLEQCVAYSYDLLASVSLRDCFSRLSLFPVYFNLEDAKALLQNESNVQSRLDELQNVSLLRRFEFGGSSYYYFDRFTRAFASDKFKELEKDLRMECEVLFIQRVCKVAEEQLGAKPEVKPPSDLECICSNLTMAMEKERDDTPSNMLDQLLIDYLMILGATDPT